VAGEYTYEATSSSLADRNIMPAVVVPIERDLHAEFLTTSFIVYHKQDTTSLVIHPTNQATLLGLALPFSWRSAKKKKVLAVLKIDPFEKNETAALRLPPRSLTGALIENYEKLSC
jgi:hypothetical protein